jgi:hypothetical protein
MILSPVEKKEAQTLTRQGPARAGRGLVHRLAFGRVAPKCVACVQLLPSGPMRPGAARPQLNQTSWRFLTFW